MLPQGLEPPAHFLVNLYIVFYHRNMLDYITPLPVSGLGPFTTTTKCHLCSNTV